MASTNLDDKKLNWTSFQKNSFRFYFLFFSMTSFSCYNLAWIISIVSEPTLERMFSFLIKPVGFLESIFHLGYSPEMGSTTLTTSTAFSWLLLILIVIISSAGAIIWRILDNKRKNYSRLNFWFNQYLASYLSLVMIWYAVAKIIPVQMPYPSLNAFLTPIGDFSRSGFTWMYIGSNPGYQSFMGWCELVAAILILFHRTRVIGTLVMMTVLINILSLNVFYNIIVKLPVIILLLTNLFLLTPYIPKLISFFYFFKPVSLIESKFRFKKIWKNYLVSAFLFLPLLVAYNGLKASKKLHNELFKMRKEQRLYDVTRFISDKDTIPPLLTDTLRWRRLAISSYRQKRMLVYSMTNKYEAYDYEFDSTNKKLILISPNDKTKKYLLNYSVPEQNKLILSGNWNSKQVVVELDKLDIENFLLIKDRIQWVDK